MQTRTVEQIEDWDSRPFSGGYAGLHELADARFSGAISAGRAWSFMLNGRVIGVFEGSLDDFDARDGTAYTAPDPSLPLLFTMLELGGETRANYYTNKTPLTEADEMLSEGNFVGYIELSENVLSGDYYTVYYGGRSMSAAFVGASERLHTGDEAFERAADEVGIYEVVEVDLELIDLPELDEPEPEPEPTTGGAGSATPASTSSASDEPSAPEPDTPTPEPEPPAEEPDVRAESEPTPASAPSTSTPEPAETQAAAGEAESKAESRSAKGAATDESGGSNAAARDRDGRTDDVFSEEEQWRETKSIPSIDPDRTEGRRSGRAESRSGRPAGGQAAAQKPPARKQERSESGRTAERRAQRRATEGSSGGRARSGASEDDASAKLRSALERAKAEIQRLRDEVGELESDRADLEEERSELAAEVRRLRSELEEARANASSGGDGATGEKQLSPAAALDGTNLFVRYGSKGKATLETAHAGRADKDEVNANLKLEHHTQFDADAVSVEGQPFEEFLHSSIQYDFVRWAIEDLLYEIRDTGRQTGLGDVYDALPRVDRAELGGEMTMTTTVEGEERERTESFDVILRDRMGNPLLVANLNDSRDPATGEVMASLVESANAVCERHEELGAAFYVTASFFEPDALETAAEATSGGLLSREKRDSYVKFARKRGYHLCLIESRAGEFHVNVPEL